MPSDIRHPRSGPQYILPLSVRRGATEKRFWFFARDAERISGEVSDGAAAPCKALPIFQYWFARCAVEKGVRPRKPDRTRHRIAAYFVSVDMFPRGHRCNCNHNAEGNSK
jgi:hypothetical protein